MALKLALLSACPLWMSAAFGKDPALAPLKVGFVYFGPIGNGGWTYAHDHARKSLQA